MAALKGLIVRSPEGREFLVVKDNGPVAPSELLRLDRKFRELAKVWRPRSEVESWTVVGSKAQRHEDLKRVRQDTRRQLKAEAGPVSDLEIAAKAFREGSSWGDRTILDALSRHPEVLNQLCQAEIGA